MKQKIESILNFAMNKENKLKSCRIMYEINEQGKVVILSAIPTEGENQLIFFCEDFKNDYRPSQAEIWEALFDFVGI